MTLQELLVKLGLDASAFESGLNDSQSHLEKWADKIDDFGTAAMGAGATLTAGLTLPLVGLSAAALSVAGDMEQNRIAFTQMLGSAEAAGQFLEELRAFAAKTPFEFPELVQTAKRMKAMGFEAAAVIPMMTAIGDASAAMGGGAVMVDRITTALGQMQAKAKVSAQEMMQLTETGIPAWKLLADAIGVSIPQAMKMAEKGSIDAGTAINAILAGMQSEFGGMMEQQSRTLQGQWSNLQDQLATVLDTIGAALIPFATAAIQAAAPILDVIQGMAEGFGTLPEPVQTIIVAVAGLAAAIGPVLVAVGAMASGISSIIGLAATLGIGIGAIVAGLKIVVVTVAAVAAAWAAWNLVEWLGLAEPIQKALDWMAEKIKTLIGWIMKIPGVETAINKVGEGFDWLKKKISGAGDESEKSVKANEKQDKSLKNLIPTIKATGAAEDKAAKEAEKAANRRIDAWMVMQKRYDDLADWFGKAYQRLKDLDKQLEDSQRSLAATYQKAHEAIRQAALKTVEIVVPLNQRIPEGIQQAIQKNKELAEAYKSLGITSSEVLAKKAEEAERAYATIRNSGRASAQDVLKAEKEALEASIAARQSAGEQIADSETKRLNDLKRATEQHTKEQKSLWSDFGNQVSTIFTDLSKGIADVIFEGKGLGEVFKGTFEEMGKAALRFVTEYLEGKLFKALGQLVEDILPSVGGALSKVFGSGASAAGSAATGAAGTAGGVGSGAGAVGAAASGLMGTLGAIGSIGSMVSGVIGNFQNAKMETTLNAIEKSTRYTEIATIENGTENIFHFTKWTAQCSEAIRDRLTQFVDDHAWRIHDVWEVSTQIRDAIRSEGAATRDAIVASKPQSVNVQVQGNVIGNQEFMQQVAMMVAGQLRTQGVAI